ANLLVLDEPTNDLDVETLELLEDILLSFDGTVILVSHDRDFMDHVVTQLLILRGDGTVEEQAGGYSDWEARGGRLTDPAGRGQQMPASKPEPAPTAVSPTTPAAPARRKLSYKEQRELEALPGKIEELEQQQAAYQAQAADPAFYQQGRDTMDKVLAELAAVEEALEAAIERWTELEG
ncbi:MAG: ABC transporter ATP-binding protein, partial [Haliea sp.]